jgi:hypothetical protein
MKALKKFQFMSIILILVLSAAVVTPVLAGPPEFYDEVIDYTGPLENPCGFEITVHSYGTIRWQYFFDKNGVLTDAHAICGQMKETWSANGKSVDVQISGPIQYKIISDTQVIDSIKGTAQVITVPGFGKIYGQAGHFAYKWDYTTEPWTFIEVVREAGTSAWDLDPVCAYLAP